MATRVNLVDLAQLKADIVRVLEAPNSSDLDVRTLKSLVGARNELELEVREWLANATPGTTHRLAGRA